MSRIIIAAWLLLGAACAQAQPAVTAPCQDDKISNAAGLVIQLASGQDFQAYPGAQGVISGWLPLDRVSVCGIGGIAVKITNLSKKYQSVKALRIFPTNSGGVI